MNHHAGTAIRLSVKMKKQIIRVLGKSTRYAPVTAAIAPDAPIAGSRSSRGAPPEAAARRHRAAQTRRAPFVLDIGPGRHQHEHVEQKVHPTAVEERAGQELIPLEAVLLYGKGLHEPEEGHRIARLHRERPDKHRGIEKHQRMDEHRAATPGLSVVIGISTRQAPADSPVRSGISSGKRTNAFLIFGPEGSIVPRSANVTPFERRYPNNPRKSAEESA